MRSFTWLMFCAVVHSYSILEDTRDCIDGQQLASNVDPHQYFRCVRGSWRTLFCDTGRIYSSIFRTCKELPVIEPTPPAPQPDSCEPPGDCPLNAYFPDSCNCRRFYQCDYGGAVHKECGPGTAWNPKIETCDYIYHVKLCKTLGQA